MSEGGAYVHNLFAGPIEPHPELSRETPFHKAHSTAVAGLRKIEGGDDRYFNNIFVGNNGLAPYDKAVRPMQMAGNVFLKGAQPAAHEQDVLALPEFDPDIKLVEEKDGVYLHITLDKALAEKQPRQLITTELLARATVPDLSYEQPDGSPLKIDTDYLGKKRSEKNPTAGPFKNPGRGKLVLKVW
jgi:alpha-N-arabinofuranosidase